jgi:hypothetical protein
MEKKEDKKKKKEMNFVDFLKVNKINFYMTTSPYTNKNRIVDRVIRTIRDIVGEDESKMMNIQVVQDAVNLYNRTKHKAFDKLYSPLQVQNNPELEEYFIRRNQERLNDALKRQRYNKFFEYKPYDILLIHTPVGKTEEKFRKGRRQFNHLAEFVRYNCGNVMCKKLMLRAGQPHVEEKLIEVPIYYTRYVANDIDSIPKEYFEEFLF